MNPPLANENPGKPRLAIYGGAFNPATVGHVRVAEALLRDGFDRIVVMPCFGHAFGKSLASAAARLHLAVLAFEHLPKVRISSFEIDLGMTGSTYELVRRLPLFPESASHEIFMAIGSDEANVIHRWRRNEELRSTIPFAVVGRPGHPLGEGGRWATRAPHRLIPLAEETEEVSSTAARSALAAGDFTLAGKYLSPRVLEHIRARDLYLMPCTV